MAKGRPKGSGNKQAPAERFVARIEDMLGKSNPEWAGGLERQACRFIASKDLKVAFGVWSKLVEYKYKKPPQPTEISGKDGGPMQVQIVTNASFAEL